MVQFFILLSMARDFRSEKLCFVEIEVFWCKRAVSLAGICLFCR